MGTRSAGGTLNNSYEHQKLVNEILIAAGALPYVRLWPRVVGVGRAIHGNSVISFGIPGECDIDGIHMNGGRRIGIEIKTGTGALSDKQKRWRAMLEKFGAIYIEARSVDQVLTALKAAL